MIFVSQNAAMEGDSVVESKEGLFSADYVTFRLDFLEQKVQLVALRVFLALSLMSDASKN